MPAPFQSYLDPSVGQYGVPSTTAYGTGDQNPNPNPVMSSAANPLGWSNYQSYSPFTEPNGVTGQNPSFSGVGGYYYNSPFNSNPNTGNGLTDLFKQGTSDMGFSGIGNDVLGMLGIMGNKKWSMPDISSPSYQGQLFNPDTGPYAQNYGYSSNQQPQSYAQNNYTSAQPMGYSPSSSGTSVASGQYGPYASGSGLSGTQSYVGQSPYAVAGQSYVPSNGGGVSYGGYSSYGGYGNSNVGTQPYFPGQ